METNLDVLHKAFVETQGNDEALFSGELGICLVQPDTDEDYRGYVVRENWGNLSRLVMSGWQVHHFWNELGLITPADLIFSLYAPHALPITQSAVIWRMLQPLKPMSLSPNRDYIGIWRAVFLQMQGFDLLLLSDVNGIKILQESKEEQAAGLVTYFDFIIMRGLVDTDLEPDSDT